MKLYLYPGSTAYECRFCKREEIPLTFLQGNPVCPKCTIDKGFEPVEMSESSVQPKRKPPLLILTPEDEAAILELLSRGPATTAEVGQVLGDKPLRDRVGDRNKSLKKLVQLQQRGKVFRFFGKVGRTSWWASSPDAKIPGIDGKTFREQFVEILAFYGRKLSLEELNLKLGKSPRDIRSVGAQLEQMGKIRRFREGDEEFYELI